MSILIKGAKMPSCCFDCIFRDKTWDECNCPPTRHYGILSCLADDKRASFCPLVELPEKHGRLVDADAYVSMMEGKCDYEKALDPYVLSVCRGGIKLMPTIVEAEGEE